MMTPAEAETSPSAASETAHSRFAVIVVPDRMIGIKGAVEEIGHVLFGDHAVQAARGLRIPFPLAYWNEWIAEWRPFLSGRVDVPGTDRDVAWVAMSDR
jgi:hypothetical protein